MAGVKKGKDGKGAYYQAGAGRKYHFKQGDVRAQKSARARATKGLSRTKAK